MDDATRNTPAATTAGHERIARQENDSTRTACSMPRVSTIAERVSPRSTQLGTAFPSGKIEKARRSKENGGGDQNKDHNKDQDQCKDDGFGRSVGSLHTFAGVGDRLDKKVLARAVAVNAVVADVPHWLNRSEQSITWSREDHAPCIEYPG
jgi:hypothetical protein